MRRRRPDIEIRNRRIMRLYDKGHARKRIAQYFIMSIPAVHKVIEKELRNRFKSPLNSIESIQSSD